MQRHLRVNPYLVKFVETSGHEFHADPAVALLEDGPVEGDDEVAVATLHNHVQVHQLFLLSFVDR